MPSRQSVLFFASHAIPKNMARDSGFTTPETKAGYNQIIFQSFITRIYHIKVPDSTSISFSSGLSGLCQANLVT